MAHHVTPHAGPPRSRLEGWLLASLQAGDLSRLPRYQPLGQRTGQCPVGYAQSLLAGLNDASGDARKLESLRDDARAFRSWAELFGLRGSFRLPGVPPRGSVAV